MSYKWNKYYSILSSTHKKRYDDIEQKYKYHNIRVDDLNKEYHDLFKIFQNSQLYREARVFYDTNLRDRRVIPMGDAQMTIYKQLLEHAEENFERKEELDNMRILLIDARNVLRGYCNMKERFRSSVYILYDLPEVEVEKTDNKDKQCAICMENKKDRALPCGHILCIACVDKIKSECPNCKKSFVRNKVIKLFD